MRIAVAQMCSGIDPAKNAKELDQLIESAASKSAEILFTPEMTGMVDRDRKRAAAQICSEADDQVLMAAQEAAARFSIWVALGSLAIKSESGKWANRSFLISPDGKITARYDKIHLFDVAISDQESWRESAIYDSGDSAVVANIPQGRLGLSICYDLRFPELYARLSDGGADILAVPAAFTVPTGKAHWEVLLRARAIESAAFVVAAAQSGKHEDGRETYGHSMVVDPWGRIVLDMGANTGLGVCDLDFEEISKARGRIPVLEHRRKIDHIPQQ